MKTSLKFAFALALLSGFAAQGAQNAPPPLRPAELLPSSGGSAAPKPVKPVTPLPIVTTTDPVVQRPARTSSGTVEKQASRNRRSTGPSVERRGKPSAKPKASSSRQRTRSEQRTRGVPAHTGGIEKLDRAAILYNKCVAIEKLSKRKSAIRCMDRFLDRMDIEVGNVETRIMNCGELRRLENLEKGELVRDIVVGKMKELRAAQQTAIDANAAEVERAGERVGPRKLKEIQLRAAEAHRHAAIKLGDFVCSKPAFEMMLEKR